MNAYRPTVSQQLIWLDQLLSRTSSKYNIGGYACLEGNLNYAFFNEAIQQLLCSQEILASQFTERDGVLEVHLDQALNDYNIELIDFSSDPHPDEAAMRWMEGDFSVAFNMERQLLFNFKLLKVHDTKHFWYARIHHIISDGWSFKLLLNQTAEIYNSLEAGQPVPSAVYTYSDYAAEDEQYYRSTEAANDRSFWLSGYSTLAPELFKAGRKDGGEPVPAAAGSQTLYLPADVKSAMQQFADSQKCSLFHLVTSLLLLYFSRTGRQDEISVAIPVLNRTKKVYRQVAGVFMNLLSLKFELCSESALKEVLSHVKQKMAAALRHQRYQYGNMVKELNLPVGRQLYDIRISYEDFDFAGSFGHLRAQAVALSNHSETDKLAIYLRDYNGQGFDIRFVYNREYLNEAAIQHVCDSFAWLVSSLPSIGELPVQEIPLMEQAQVDNILALSRGPVKERPSGTYLDLWRKAVEAYPGRVAVSGANGAFTYRQIDQQAARLAAALASYKQDGFDKAVLFLPRTELMISALLGSIMAGIVYIPLDPSSPLQRIADILSDAGCRLLLTSRDMAGQLAGLANVTILNIEAAEGQAPAAENSLSPSPHPEMPCYIIYTSGSTGTPKGVMISHRSLLDYVCTFTEYFEISENDVVMQQSSLSFDTSVEEIFPVLARGGRLHILEDRKDLAGLMAALEKEDITLLSTNPFVIKLLNEYIIPSSLRVIISGGDVLKYSCVDKLLRQEIPVYNTYGPTESTVCATYYPVQPEDRLLPIGKPVSNREVFILDDHLCLQPLGVEGEICLGGAGLAMGYINNDALTEEKFVPFPHASAQRIYRTGDNGVMMPDGNILFSGRKDSQLSYRGYRIEPYEIEKILYGHEYVKECAVDVKNYKDVPFLVAYITVIGPGKDPRPATKEWRQYMKSRLPAYMIPEVWVLLPGMPLLPSGKIDRRSLPELTADMFQSGLEEKVLPVTSLEMEIAAIWKEILRLPLIGREDVFFELGGHSLNIIQLVNQYYRAFEVKISVKELFDHVTVAAHARLIEEKTATGYIAISKAPASPDYPVSASQHRLWVLSQLEDTSRAYHLQGHLELGGEHDPSHLEAAIRTVIGRHEILRTVFRESEEGELRQMVLPAETFPFSLSYLEEYRMPQDAIRSFLQEEASHVFDLAAGPLFRAGLIRTGSEDYLFYYTLHHIISDGWSMEILGKEVLSAWEMLANGRQVHWPALPVQYSDYAVWQQEQLQTEKFQAHRAYWLAQLSDAPPGLSLPLAKQRSPVITYKGQGLSTWIREDTVSTLRALCLQHQCTLFMGLLAAFKALLYRYTYQDDMIIGTAVAGRDHPDLEDQIGCYINMLPLRTALKGSESFISLLGTVRETMLSGYAHQEYPFDRMVQELNLQRDMSRSPLFDIVLILQSQQERSSAGTLPDKIIDEGECAVKFDLTLDFAERKEGLCLTTQFNTDIYDKAVIVSLLEHFGNLLEAILLNPDTSLADYVFLSSSEQQRLLQEFNDTSVGYPEDKTILDLFVQQVEHSPLQTAVIFEDRSLNYRQLDQFSNQLAHSLIQKGVGIDSLVPVCLERSPEMIIAIIGILKAGAAYVPIDPAYPQDRIQYMYDDVKASVVVTDHQLAVLFANTAADILRIDDEQLQSYPVHRPGVQVAPGNLAYIIYTSGSTGRPKGVMISHQNVVRLFVTEQPLYDFNNNDVWTLFHSYSFDFSVWEIFGALLFGGKLVIVPRDLVRDTDRFARLLCRQGVTVLNQTPQAFYLLMQTLLESGDRPPLRYVIFGGEALNPARLAQWHNAFPLCRLINMYGITETTVHVTFKEIGEPEIRAGISNIGVPIPTLKCYVLDQRLQLVPVGVSGELYVSGAGLARGYLHRPELTGERFIPDPFNPGQRLYRSGDLARWRDDGNLEYLGRKDAQVKIRGYRIELGEVEQGLLSVPGIKAAVALAGTDHAGYTFLAAYVVADKPVDHTALRADLHRLLPEYMIPSCFLQLDELPLTQNGKVNKSALPDPLLSGASRKTDYTAPRNETESILTGIYETVLNRSAVSVKDNFFDLGLTSLTAVKIRMEIRKQLGVPVELRELYKLVTIEELAQMIDSLKWLATDNNNDDIQKVEEFII